MKVILLIDMPNNMSVEETKALNVTLFNGLIVKELKIDCPLKSLPQKKEIDEDYKSIMWWDDACDTAYSCGYNTCLEDILYGESE